MSKRHVIKYTHHDGEELPKPKYWCGREALMKDEWAFQGAQHVAVAAGGSIAPCKNCVKSIIKHLEIEL